MNKVFRCLTCGFALTVAANDARSLAEINALHHKKELDGVSNKEECPSCHGYLKRYGGRKNGKVEMPDITTPGTLEDESIAEVQTRKNEIEADFKMLTQDGGKGKISALRKKWEGKKLFGYSVDDLLELHAKQKV